MRRKKSLGKVVCLLTDFGLFDHYVGTMKGVLLAAEPEAQIIDLTHDIPPQNVRVGAYQLMASVQYHPKGTLFLCVVDPGVGSDRKIIYVEAGDWRFIAPDNGLLSWVLDRVPPKRIIDISNAPGLPKKPGQTFHGRDIMAPVAGRILKGEDPTAMGPTLSSFVKIPFPQVKKIGAMWTGEVIARDRYGNLISNFRSSDIAPFVSKAKIWIELNDRPDTIRGISTAYASVAPGKLVAIEGSTGFIEISVRDGNATQKTKLKEGDKLTLHFRT